MPASSTGCASGAEIYLHFASQASFERADSTWANQHRTSYADVERWWQGRARLLPPYTTLTLSDLAHQSTPAAAYRPAAAARRSMRTEERLSEERAAVIDAADTARLQRKLNLWRWLLWPLFPRGFAFEAGDKALVYDPRRGRVRIESAGDHGDFVVSVPARPSRKLSPTTISATSALPCSSASGSCAGSTRAGLWALRAVSVRRLRPYAPARSDAALDRLRIAPQLSKPPAGALAARRARVLF